MPTGRHDGLWTPVSLRLGDVAAVTVIPQQVWCFVLNRHDIIDELFDGLLHITDVFEERLKKQANENVIIT
jgi:hypothetical protein